MTAVATAAAAAGNTKKAPKFSIHLPTSSVKHVIVMTRHPLYILFKFSSSVISANTPRSDRNGNSHVVALVRCSAHWKVNKKKSHLIIRLLLFSRNVTENWTRAKAIVSAIFLSFLLNQKSQFDLFFSPADLPLIRKMFFFGIGYMLSRW